MLGYKPSQLGWPNILANRIGRECVNLSLPGIGNLEILMKILRTEFKPDDLVIIAYTYFVRYPYYRITDINTGAGERIGYRDEEYKKQLLEEGELSNNLYEKNYWQNWLAIHQAELFLNSLNIKNYSYQGVPAESVEKKPKILNLKNHWTNMYLILQDFAADNKHPGLKSHNLQSELIYSKIKHELYRCDPL